MPGYQKQIDQMRTRSSIVSRRRVECRSLSAAAPGRPRSADADRTAHDGELVIEAPLRRYLADGFFVQRLGPRIPPHFDDGNSMRATTGK